MTSYDEVGGRTLQQAYCRPVSASLIPSTALLRDREKEITDTVAESPAH
ncbi:hypothetical protein [Streptomyces sp. NPDC014894]